MQYLIKVPTPEGLKAVTVRPPTDPEWVSYLNARRVIDKLSTGGGTETVIEGAEEANTKLFAAIRVDGPELDSETAELVIDRLTRVQTLACECHGASFAVRLKTMGTESEHALRMPSAKQMKEAESAVRVIGHGKRGTEYRVDLQRFGAIYDQLSGDAAGILQKRVAVQAVMEFLREQISGDEGSFF